MSKYADSERDDILALLLGELADGVASGREMELDVVCRDHPQLADELRSLWCTMLVADIAGTGQPPPSVPFDPVTTDSIKTFSGKGADPFRIASRSEYEISEEIGRGGMGVVYRAKQVKLQREVAIKMIARGKLATSEELQRFRAETTAAARLEHPRIVKVYEVGELDGQAFFAMQLIRGETLSAKIQSNQLTCREITRIIAEVARAVDYAHQRGVLHRDLKPSNILLDEHNSPHVSDFGLAKLFSVGDELSLTKTGATLGTPMYMSPEQAAGRRGGKMGPAVDVYSLGAVLYHALTGSPPLTAETPVELLAKVIEQEPVAPRRLRPDIDRDLEMIVIRCLQKPADLRYQSAGELAADLEAYLNDEPISARSGRFLQVMSRLFRETHHAVVLENWGVLWMWHAFALLIASTQTWYMQYTGVTDRFAYSALWTLGLGAWASVFWALRRRLGPVTFVERQIAHVWASSMISIALLFPLEGWLNLPVLSLSPLLAVSAAMIFLIKAAILDGAFYVQTACLLVTAAAMAAWPSAAHLLFGVVAGSCFLIPGWKYYRQR